MTSKYEGVVFGLLPEEERAKLRDAAAAVLENV